ncbi:unnamed protein product [Rotaria sp. Silwood1]|nr:unnamed protein product [Rotaria sp. Silwood1]
MSNIDDVESNTEQVTQTKIVNHVQDNDETEPTDEELSTLEHISDQIPLTAWLIVVCEFCERFAFIGLSGPFQNYIQFPIPGPHDKQPGALARGHRIATLLTTFFQFLCFFTPIGGAILADQFWGKYKTIVFACIIYVLGLLVLVLTSIPFSIHTGIAFPGLIVSIIIIGLATGGLKSNVSPLMAQQYTRTKPIIKGNC